MSHLAAAILGAFVGATTIFGITVYRDIRYVEQRLRDWDATNVEPLTADEMRSLRLWSGVVMTPRVDVGPLLEHMN